MDDLVQFLRDRLDEAQAEQENPFTAWHNLDCEAVPDTWGREPGACTCGVPARVLREVDAKRRLLDLHEPGTQEYVDGDVCMACTLQGDGPYYPCATLRLLALPYADHPDYQDTWLP